MIGGGRPRISIHKVPIIPNPSSVFGISTSNGIIVKVGRFLIVKPFPKVDQVDSFPTRHGKYLQGS